jgi:AraC family transcriptional regulator
MPQQGGRTVDWLERMTAALDYIEANLGGHIDLSVAARGACCSAYHFSRMFSFITGVPLNEYIRRRRLTLAGFELKHSDARIIDLALKYSYDSPNSFTWAFQSMHGVTPSEARTPDVALKAFSRMCFVITIKGVTGMDYRIVEEGPFTMFGKSFRTSSVDGRCYREVPEFWDQCLADGTNLRIRAAGGIDEKTRLKAVTFDYDADGNFSYMIGLDLPAGGVSDEWERVDVPAKTWAVFPKEIVPETDSVISVWQRIYPEWFPNSGYEQDEGSLQERIRETDRGTLIVEAWVPVKKAQGRD